MISNFKFKISNFVAKLRELPEVQKKVIFFAVIVVAALIIGFFEIRATMKNIAKIQSSLKEVKFPELQTPNY